ncbi:hypothetical protein [Gordonia otitidis]|uniref:Uncharacterized protein n=1 Tax=Gordonia otitidis (strain DSM 44809 / CCUG 52243 / JCM 12355 / NBRC 100426 / IFM 10032) TaxID=1108044 RepID=H5TIW6_GORO1|nr:hypothetical protein [Gordonia otitidis]GAB33424.1 hypothetical protein GOOTI_065_00290 [Gordonia otitidis NBRC 100426]
MTDQFPDQDVTAVRRSLRIERAVIGAVLHGYRADNHGFNAAITDLWVTEQASAVDVNITLFWALSRLPRNGEEPTQLQDRLAVLYGVSDDD